MIRADLGYWIGLGNQLFILAAAESFAKQTDRKFYINNSITPFNPHSSTNYFDSILKNFIPLKHYPEFECLIDEQDCPDYKDWPSIIKSMNIPMNILLKGYFQNWKYVDPVRDTFIQRLSFNTEIEKKYPDISESVFVHVRGRDYLTWVGFVDLTKYYEKCLSMVQDKIVVFTDDPEYARKVVNSKFEMIMENEVDSLYLMSKCKGCICSNSTFSWWGAYLNPNRQIFIPSKWPNNTENYSFPGTTIVEV
jgi:Glycosyl transferase family 11